jgi:hypothetical protein
LYGFELPQHVLVVVGDTEIYWVVYWMVDLLERGVCIGLCEFFDFLCFFTLLLLFNLADESLFELITKTHVFSSDSFIEGTLFLITFLEILACRHEVELF